MPSTSIPLPLRIIQLLGYFPIPFHTAESPQPSNLRNHSTKRILPFHNKIPTFLSKLSKSRIIPLIPPIFFILISISMTAIFFLNFSTMANSSDVRSRLKRKGGKIFYSALILKSSSHIVCSTFVKFDMVFSKRTQLAEFYYNFTNFLTNVSLHFTGNFTNRFEKRFNIEFFVFLGIITFWNIELFYDLTNIRSPIYFYVYFIPLMLGYLHSIFVFLVLHFLNWYLEIVARIRIAAQNKLEFYRVLNLDKVPIELEDVYPQNSGISANSDNILRKNGSLNCTDCEILIAFYKKVALQVDQFNSLFRLWITIDVLHSLLRIVFSGYFISSLISRPGFRWRSVVQNWLTVVLYLYLIYKICKKGSDLYNWVRDDVFAGADPIPK
ncbi:hypothetical protein Fcan01_20212 [Folsomia candida]|uniref:Uncharacterized protein n=1 Tax=Folsomia candida TaxID=158441 RepID=A0A226DIX0_FOLCA|nr:hypothetical protein Fcan01_20212 [Folsomia candida]